MLYGLTTFFLILLSSSIVFSSVVEKQRALASNVASRFSFGLAISSKDGVVLAKAISKTKSVKRVCRGIKKLVRIFLGKPS